MSASRSYKAKLKAVIKDKRFDLRLQPFSICILAKGQVYIYGWIVTNYIRIIYSIYTVVVGLFFTNESPLSPLSPCFCRSSFLGSENVAYWHYRDHVALLSALLSLPHLSKHRRLVKERGKKTFVKL